MNDNINENKLSKLKHLNAYHLQEAHLKSMI